MITDQSQPPRQGARQVVYTHTHITHTHTHYTHAHTLLHLRTHMHTHIVNVVAGECALAHLAVKLQNLHSQFSDAQLGPTEAE